MDNQEHTLRAYALEHGYHVEREFRFQETADLKIRRKFQEMISFVKARKSVTAIIGYRVDRLTRNYHDHVVLDDLRLNHGKMLHFVHDRLVIDRNSVGREITEWDTKVYLAKAYLNRLKEDARATITFKLSKGEWPGKAPYGYRNTKKDGRSWIEPHETESVIAARMQRLYAGGSHSMESVRAAVKKEYGAALSKGKVDHILKNPFYSGWMRFEGQLYRHGYTPIVPFSVYRRILEVKEGHKKVSYKFAGLEFPYRGILTCGTCGCRVTCERKRKGGRTYHYYHCTQYFGKHEAAYLSEAELDERFDALLRRLTIPPKWAEKIERRLMARSKESSAVLDKRRKLLLAERQRVQTRLETLYDDRLDGVLPLEAYQERRAKAEQTVVELDRQLEDLTRTTTDGYECSISFVRLCSRVREGFKGSKASKNERS